jgi:hypothetical protein
MLIKQQFKTIILSIFHSRAREFTLVLFRNIVNLQEKIICQFRIVLADEV